MPLGLRYLGHRCQPGEAIVPWYFAGQLELEPGQVFAVPDEGLMIGRGRSADVRVASNGVARHHARVEPVDGGTTLFVQDLESTNGTSSNQGDGRTHRLSPGDTLTLAGRFDFEVVTVP